MRRIIFITRGDGQQGMGHLHRVSWLSAAIAAQQRGDLTLARVCLDSPEARDFWASAGADCQFADSMEQAAAQLAAGDMAVVDWLDSPRELVRSIATRVERSSGSGRVVLLDEYGPAAYEADLVINALLSPLQDGEERYRETRILSGASYVQLPLAALALRGSALAKSEEAATLLTGPTPRVGPVLCILLSFGGLPQPELITSVLVALHLADFRGKVIVMPAPHTERLEPVGLDVEYLPASAEFHSYLAGSDMAVLGGGLSLYEAAFFGVPALCIPLVEHQLNTALKLERAGCCRLAGELGDIIPEQLAAKLKGLIGSPRLRGRMSFKGMRLIDGRGLQRTVDAILELDKLG